MKGLALIAALAIICGFVSGCAGLMIAPVIPPMGFVYSDVKAPLDVDYDNSTVTGKRGTASSISILGLVAVGDASAKAAAESAGITRIEHADYEIMSVLWVFAKYTTIVYGQ